MSRTAAWSAVRVNIGASTPIGEMDDIAREARRRNPIDESAVQRCERRPAAARKGEIDAIVNRVIEFARKGESGTRKFRHIDKLRNESPHLAHRLSCEFPIQFAAPCLLPEAAGEFDEQQRRRRQIHGAAESERLAASVSDSAANQQSATLASTTISLTSPDLP